MENLENISREELLDKIRLLEHEMAERESDALKKDKLERELKQSEEKFKELFDSSPLGKSITGLDGSLKTNKAFSDILGYSPKELSALKWQQITHPDDINETEDVIKSLLDGKSKKAGFEKRYIHKNGSVIWADVVTFLKKGENNQAEYFLTTIKDVTDEKIALEKTNRYARIFENSLNEIYLFDSKTFRFIQVNGAAQKNIGYSMEELCKMTPPDIKPDFTLDDFAKLTKPLFEMNEEKIVFETVHQRKNKSLYDVEVHLQLLSFKNTNTFVAIILDITGRKIAEKNSFIQRQKLEEILEGTNAGTWDWDIQTGDCSFNERWANIMGYTLKELEPLNVYTWSNSLHPDDLAKTNETLDDVFNKKLDYFDVEFRQGHKQGGWVWVNARGKVVEWLDNGKPLRMSGIHLDISARKNIEKELLRHRLKLEEIVKNRTEELETKNKELSEAMNVFVGRERKIIELQNKIDALQGL